jgi:Flp pilus assembly protein TadG
LGRKLGESSLSAGDHGAANNVMTDKSIWRPIFKSLRRLARGDSGSAAVLVAISLVPIFGMMGLAIDVGQLRFAKQRLQMTADAAALAGALELNTCGATADCSALETAAQNALTENGFTGSTLQASCIPSGTGLAISVNNGPCALGSQNPHNGNRKYVEAVVSQAQPTYFAGLLGIPTVQIMARAEAGQTGGTNCMFALDPTASGAITVDFLASVNSPCGIVDESSSNSALQCSLLASISASQIGVVGGVSTFWCNISPTPRTHIAMPNPTDPLAYLPEPAVPSCGTSSSPSATHHGSNAKLAITNTTTLYADNAYCGGISILPGARVTFDTTFGSTFVLTSTNGGPILSPYGLTIDLGTTVTGNGVTFYNYGPSGGITFNFAGFTIGGVNLTAPTSGTYSGILFFQDNGNTSQAQIAGSSSWNTKLQGTYYLPSAKVLYALDGVVAYNILVAKDIEVTFLTFLNGYTAGGSQQFSNDYSSLANGSPLSGSGAVLVQ